MNEQQSQYPSQSGYSEHQQKPAPKGNGERVLKAIGMVTLGVGVFFAGSLAHYFSLDSEMRALISLKRYIQNYYYQEITDEQFYDAAFNGVDGLLDAYSKYLTPEELVERMTQATGEHSGLGVAFSGTATGEDQLKIMQITGNSPAEKAGLLAGERIVGYGASESEIGGVLTFEAFSNFLGGYRAGQEVYLKIRSFSGQERVVCIAKANFLESCVSYRAKDTAYRFVKDDNLEKTADDNVLEKLAVDTAYIRLTSFNGVAAEEFDMAMTQFKTEGKKNLVLDLRGNTGGYLDIMVDIAKYFCKSATTDNPIAMIADYGEKKENFYATDNLYDEYFQADSRITVLADNLSASASECLIGCMYDYGAIGFDDICLSQRGEEVKTFGKGIMQTTYPFINGTGAAKLTTATVHWPLSNRCIHGRGILPEDGALQVAENVDFEAELNAALTVLFG